MLYKLFLLYYLYKSDTSFFLLTFLVMLLFTLCATSNASRLYKSDTSFFLLTFFNHSSSCL